MSTGTREPAPRPENEIDAAVADTFPASDPPSTSQPVTAAPAVEETHDPSGRPQQVYRVVPRDNAEDAFGAEHSLSGGRWSSPGTPAVYAATSPAAALLEYLAHLEGDSPDELVLVTAQLPTGSITTAEVLPEQWRERPYRQDVREHGDRWIAEQRSLALRVPSVLCPNEHNVVINPQHTEARELKIRAIDPLQIDPRLRY